VVFWVYIVLLQRWLVVLTTANEKNTSYTRNTCMQQPITYIFQTSNGWVAGSQAPFVLRGQLPPGSPIIHCILCKCNVLCDRHGAIGRAKQKGPAMQCIMYYSIIQRACSHYFLRFIIQDILQPDTVCMALYSTFLLHLYNVSLFIMTGYEI
jgi:hypothetical protein